MLDPTTSLVYVVSAVISGIIGNRSDAAVTTLWDNFSHNLKQYHSDSNHELERAAYRAYLKATLQTCAALSERMGTVKRSHLSETPAGVFTQANQQWVESVRSDHLKRLKQLDEGAAEPPNEYEHPELAALIQEMELLMQPQEAKEREQAIRATLAARVLNDLEQQFGEVPAKFKALVKERWFDFLCASFQHDLMRQPEIASSFERQLLATLVARSDWQGQLTMLARIETDLKAIIDKPASQASNEPEPLIHSLPTHQEIEGRREECATIIDALSKSEQRVVVFAAPGGFGKTALLAKVVKEISVDGKMLLEAVDLPKGKSIETRSARLLHIDCRNEVKLSTLFANAGRLIGEKQNFHDIYNSDAGLPYKLEEIFSRLSADGLRTWFVFDNFEPLLNRRGEVAAPDVHEFFTAIFRGGHCVYALISSREVPKFSRGGVLELDTVGDSLFKGLPLNDCITYLRKNGAAEGLGGNDEEIDEALKKFAEKVQRIPLALIWVIGYLHDTNFTLREILDRDDLFEDFEQNQARSAQRYEDKGLKRLHYEQLKNQSSDRIRILRLLAFFKRPVPKGALAHLLDEIELNKVLTQLERNKLISLKKTDDAYTQHLNDPLAVNLYSLHPVICENEFFAKLPREIEFYEKSAQECWGCAVAASKVKQFAYASELFYCAEELFERLIKHLGQARLVNDYAAVFIGKGSTLRGLTKLSEAVAAFDKAIAIRERLVKKQPNLANDLAIAYVSKGSALRELGKLLEAIAAFDKAIAIRERLVKKQPNLTNDLAIAYVSKGSALRHFGKLSEAVAVFDKAITIRERLVEKQPNLANDLAIAYISKASALSELGRFAEALSESNKAIAIRERLVHNENKAHLANDLAIAYVNRGVALCGLSRFSESVMEFDKAIEIREELVYEEGQIHLSRDLALAYVNKAHALKAQKDWEIALSCYEQSLKAQMVCLKQLQMFWIIPELLQTLRSRLNILLDLQHWHSAAQDVRQFFSWYESYASIDWIGVGLKEAARKEFSQLIANLCALTTEQRELLYAEVGDEAAKLRSLVDSSLSLSM